MLLLCPHPFRLRNEKSKAKLDRLDNLLDLLLQDMDPEILDAASRAERQRIASLIELKEGPGRFL